MCQDELPHFAVAPDNSQLPFLVASGDWRFNLVSANKDDPKVQQISTFEAIQPNIHTRISFAPTSGWQIVEGWQPKDPQGDGNQGVVIMGSSLNLPTQGWALTVSSRVKGSTILAVSIAEQTRRSVDASSKVVGTIRGFNAPQISPDDMAAIEMYEEAGMKIKKHIIEVGLPVNMMPLWMVSRVRGGANFFSIKFPSRLLEVSDEKRRRWKIKNGIFQADAPHKEFEGVSRSEFVDISEIVSQKVWSGTADGYTVISGARTLIDNCRLNFGGYWNRLVRKKELNQLHSAYPIRRLSSDNYSELIGKKPLWQTKINGAEVHLSSLWARNVTTGEEIAYGDKPEATRYDGFAINSTVTAVMPTVEIDGRLFVGGKVGQSKNIADGDIFVTPTIGQQSSPTTENDLLSLLSEQMKIHQPDLKGVVEAIETVGAPVNPNSAHGTWSTRTVFARINPESVKKVALDKYVLTDGSSDFVFIPVEKAIFDSSHGPTVIAASVICGSAKIVSLK
jgi:hypothetical protein